jgi:chorismate mutase
MRGLLSLGSIRNVLARLEETIIFGVIERAQFKQNRIIYRPDGVGRGLGGLSLVDFLLRECEKAHAKVRRYTSPDEHPFFRGLPVPILPVIQHENPLKPNAVNLNARLRKVYEEEIVRLVCEPGDDGQWGSSAVNDVSLLQAISKRVHYGKFVAEAKRRAQPRRLAALVQEGDRAALLAAVTDAAVEAQVIARVRAKAAALAQEFGPRPGRYKVRPALIAEMYRCWIIPLNKEVQVRYLLADTAPSGGGAR